MEVKKRKARFSVHEIDLLVHEVYKNRATLFSKLCTTVSNDRKMTVWQSITESVNKVCTVQPRTAEEVRRKWYYYLSDKKKEMLKKTECVPPIVKYNPIDLKILDLLGEIDAAAGATHDDDVVEGVVCEVDADVLRRPSSASSNYSNQDHRGVLLLPSEPTSGGSLTLHPRQQDDVTSQDGSSEADVTPPTTKLERSVAGHEADMDRRSLQPCIKREPPAAGGGVEDSSSNLLREENEFLRLEKRRLELQECQLQVLKDIHRQMQVDSQRNYSFQQAFLDIQKQRLELERAATQ